MRRLAVGGFSVVLLLGLCGCYMPFGVAYPAVSYTPSAPIDPAQTHEIRAFRVNFEENHKSANQADWVKCDFQEIDLRERQEVPSQLLVGLNYSWGWYFFPGSGQAYKGSVRTSDKWVRVRLYRRGFRTIELSPDDEENTRIEWQHARDREEQEEAIDKLTGVKQDFMGRLLPGSTSPEHKLFLQFAIEEYEHVAKSIEDENAAKAKLRFHLLKKADDLRAILEK